VSGGSPRTIFDATAGSTHNMLVGLIPRAARVLEFGCASGYIAETLKARLGCSVTGIELSAEAAELARAHCDRVMVGDAETLEFERLLGGDRFDAVLFADVLEHLRDPSTVLRRVRGLLADGGVVLASIPNVAHGSVRLALLGGEFRYRDSGLLDRTHLRFFTRETVQDLFEGSGYLITHWLRRRLPIDQSEVAPPARATPPGVREWLATDPEATTYQFVVRAVPSEEASTVHHLRSERERDRSAQQWRARCRRAMQELGTVVRPGESFILIDEDRIRAEMGPEHRALPFPEHRGQYWGPPVDDASAIQELERLRTAGARFAVVAWPAFWWLEFYAGLERHLSLTYPTVVDTDSLRVYDLRPSGNGRDGG
jgi:2-polyprenyl-3-methyl-5-hydroxy-6-metoxy-1,4-benzoquinol methylase